MSIKSWWIPSWLDGVAQSQIQLKRPSSNSSHPTISFTVDPFSSHLQSFLASGGFFPRSQLFSSGGQSTGVSASVSVLPMNIQDWFPLEGLVGSPCSPRDSRAFSKTTVQKHQFFSAQPFVSSSSHVHTDYWNNHRFDYMHSRQAKWCLWCLIYCIRFLIAFLPRSKCLNFMAAVTICSDFGAFQI